jgi:hypothetical protein
VFCDNKSTISLIKKKKKMEHIAPKTNTFIEVITMGVFGKRLHTPPSLKTSTIHGRDVPFCKLEKHILGRFETSFPLFSIFALLPTTPILPLPFQDLRNCEDITVRKQQARKKPEGIMVICWINYPNAHKILLQNSVKHYSMNSVKGFGECASVFQTRPIFKI